MRRAADRQVQWVARDQLGSNSWNPNHVFRPELELLRLSIVQDGWTQPIIARATNSGSGYDFEMIDGFHRWMLAEEPQIRDLTDGLVPVVLVEVDDAHARVSTVRHNRARGTHYVNLMSTMVKELMDMGKTDEQIQDELGHGSRRGPPPGTSRATSCNASPATRWAKRGARRPSGSPTKQ